MQTTRTLLSAALASTIGAAALAAPAAADSIADVKDGNVWLMTPDGATTQAVTTAGGYSTASSTTTAASATSTTAKSTAPTSGGAWSSPSWAPDGERLA